MATDSTVLQGFVPGQLISWLAQQVPSPVRPVSDQQEMVAWFADLSNFSRLTHEITERERAGPELVGQLLNETFGPIIE